MTLFRPIQAPSPTWEQQKRILEALLFCSPNPIPLKKLQELLEENDKTRVHLLVRELQAEFAARQGGIRIVEVAGGFQMVTPPEVAPWVRRFRAPRSEARLSRAALETLAIIAYRQPLSRAEIEQIRGVDTAAVLRGLLERRLIRIVGRKKDIPGRPLLYGTTREFLQVFGLRDLSELPSLKELEALQPEFVGGEQEGEGAAGSQEEETPP